MTELTEQQYMQLHAYFDGELTGDDASSLAAEVAQDPELADELAELGLFSQVVNASFDATAAAVPEARFEQIWDEVERTLDRDSRLQQAADSSVSWWARIGSILRPFGIPAAAVGGVAAAFYFFVGGAEQTQPQIAENKVVEEASKEPAHTDAASDRTNSGKPVNKSLTQPGALAHKEANEPFPAPAPGVAEFERIDFGVSRGQVGTLEGKSGTVTVVFLHEDEPSSGERPL